MAEVRYSSFPVAKAWPDASAFEDFRAVVENEENYPLLVHCASANRVGFMWALYQLQNGIDVEVAIGQGRTIGMKPSRVAQVREYHAQTARER